MITRRDEYTAARKEGRGGRSLRAMGPAIRAAMDRELTEKQRRVIQMHIVDRIPVGRIAAELGVNRSTVYRNLDRGCRRLERALRCAVEYARQGDGEEDEE